MNIETFKRKIVQEGIGYLGGRKLDDTFDISKEDKIYFLEYLKGVDMVNFMLSPLDGDEYSIKNTETGDYITTVKIVGGGNFMEFLELMCSIQKTVDKSNNVCYAGDI